MTSNAIALKRKLEDIVIEYDEKVAKLKDAEDAFKKAGSELMTACTIGGAYSRVQVDVGSVYDRTLQESLLKSAWYHVYEYFKIERVATAKDKKEFERSMSHDVPEFTFDNVVASLGQYVLDPYSSILRGLAEVFCSLDQSYKSHDKVKIGVKGLPKRVIIRNVGSYHGWGRDQIQDILNALASFQGLPLVQGQELSNFLDDGDYFLRNNTIKHYDETKEPYITPKRGVWLKKFQNGNGHLFFTPETLLDINRALSEYYGDVLADGYEEKPTERQQSTEVSKDLQFYYTPTDACSHLLRDIYLQDGDKILEPSCGEGHIIDAIYRQVDKDFKDNYSEKTKKNITVHGIEYDIRRARKCQYKGYRVIQYNFLEVDPKPQYDKVIMNPPFYGKHYVKHIEHALKFLKEDGTLWSILPITARYDHGVLDKKFKCQWSDLPVGSFSETGTNINTTVVRIHKKG